MTYVVFDTETTGFTKNFLPPSEPCSVTELGAEVMQIGGLVFTRDLQPVRAFCHYCDIMVPKPEAQAYEVHGIDITSIRKYLPGVFLDEVIHNYIPELLLDDVVLVGYNVEFDLRMVIQCMRNYPYGFKPCKIVRSMLPKKGRHSLDVLSYLPHRVKLSSFSRDLDPDRKEFFAEYAGKLPFETNAPEILGPTWSRNHNALFDALETFLLLKKRVWGIKLLV